MDSNSFKRRIARFTWATRVSLGLASRGQNGPAALPFRRAVPLGRGVPERLDALEIDVERMIRGWDQHIPAMLAVAAERRGDTFEIGTLRAQLDVLQQTVARLEAELAGTVPTRSAEAPGTEPPTLARQGAPAADKVGRPESD